MLSAQILKLFCIGPISLPFYGIGQVLKYHCSHLTYSKVKVKSFLGQLTHAAGAYPGFRNHQGPVPERCNNSISGVNMPEYYSGTYIYPLNRVITPFRNRSLATMSPHIFPRVAFWLGRTLTDDQWFSWLSKWAFRAGDRGFQPVLTAAKFRFCSRFCDHQGLLSFDRNGAEAGGNAAKARSRTGTVFLFYYLFLHTCFLLLKLD